MKPSAARQIDDQKRAELARVVAKLGSRDQALWDGHLEASEFLLLLAHGASALPSLKAAALAARPGDRPRNYWIKPGLTIRALAEQVPYQSRTPRP